MQIFRRKREAGASAVEEGVEVSVVSVGGVRRVGCLPCPVLVVAGDDEVEEGGELGGDGRLETREDGVGFAAHSLHDGVGVVDAAVFVGKGYELLDFVVGQDGFAVEEGAHGFFFTLGGGALGDGVEERKADFAFAEVVAGRFADDFRVEVVEDVVFDLETESEEFGKFADCVKTPVGDSATVGSHGGASHEE